MKPSKNISAGYSFSVVVLLMILPLCVAMTGCGSGIGKVATKVGVAVAASALGQNDTNNAKPFNGVTARCTDGTYTSSLTPKLDCDSHGGIDQRFDQP